VSAVLFSIDKGFVEAIGDELATGIGH